jgi:hypothetical protein
MKKFILFTVSVAMLAAFVFNGCKKVNNPDTKNEDSITVLPEQLAQNKDFRTLMVSLPAMRKELRSIFSTQGNKKSITDLSNDDLNKLTNQLKRNKISQEFKAATLSIRAAFPEMKNLSRDERRIVYLGAMKLVRKELSITGSLEKMSARSGSEDPECVDSCYAARQFDYDECDIRFFDEIYLCDDTYSNCISTCHVTYASGSLERAICMNNCYVDFQNCETPAYNAWEKCWLALDQRVRDCIFENCL